MIRFPTLIYRWRRGLSRDRLAAEATLPDPAFLPVEVAAGAPAHAGVQLDLLAAGVVEPVGTSGRRVRLAPPVDPRMLKVLLAGLT